MCFQNVKNKLNPMNITIQCVAKRRLKNNRSEWRKRFEKYQFTGKIQINRGKRNTSQFIFKSLYNKNETQKL